MTDIAAFPTLTHVCDQGHEFARAVKAGAAIKAGMVVAYADTGVSDTVHPAVRGTTATIAGVAAADIASGAWGTIYLNGAIVYLVNADDTTTIDAGAVLTTDDNAVGGTVSAASAKTTTTGELRVDIIGYAIEDIAASSAGSYGRVMIQMQTVLEA